MQWANVLPALFKLQKTTMLSFFYPVHCSDGEIRLWLCEDVHMAALQLVASDLGFDMAGSGGCGKVGATEVLGMLLPCPCIFALLSHTLMLYALILFTWHLILCTMMCH